MIRVDKNTPLTAKNLAMWYEIWKKDKDRLYELQAFYLNNKNSKKLLKLPYAKKLVTTAASAAAGDGVTLSASEDLNEKQKATFEKVNQLFKKQTITAQDREIIKQGCIYGRGYELVYLTDEEIPIPKTTSIYTTNAFVVFDNTVESNSLYGCYFEEYKKDKTDRIKLYVFDAINLYELDYSKDEFNAEKISSGSLVSGNPHNMGRMPLTEYHNNKEEQGDFEQIIDLMSDRSTIHNINLKDFREIAKNYMVGNNIKFAGETDEDKKKSMQKAVELQLIEVETDENNNQPLYLLSKNENYSSIDVFGRDIDSKIYDLTMIPDLSADNFAGNQTGVALELKLMPFKEMIADKDDEIEKLNRRRLKMYIHALTAEINGIKSPEYEWFDAGDIEISINRNWSKNITEIASLINTLLPTGLFSEQTLTEMLPKGDYKVEQERKRVETENKTTETIANEDANNTSAADMHELLRQLGAVNAAR